jgi:hypothetical protein
VGSVTSMRGGSLSSPLPSESSQPPQPSLFSALPTEERDSFDSSIPLQVLIHPSPSLPPLRTLPSLPPPSAAATRRLMTPLPPSPPGCTPRQTPASVIRYHALRNCRRDSDQTSAGAVAALCSRVVACVTRIA